MTSSVLVIGASGEIGSSICKHLASNGMRLFMTGRNREKLKGLLSSLEGKDHKIMSRDYQYEIEEEGDLFSTENFDGIILITPRPSANLDSTPHRDEWKALFNDCFIGPLDILRKAILHLKNNSKLVILSGITSKQYYPPLPQFAVLRSAWLAEAKALSHQLGERGISVNSLSLGGVWSQRLNNIMESESQKSGESLAEIRLNRVKNIPLRDYAELSEVAYTVEKMLGKFTDHISGQNFVMDGGFVSAY